MEHKVLIDLSVKYGLSDNDLSKLTDMLYQLGYSDLNDKDCQRSAQYICSMNLLKLPAENLLEEMRLKGFGVKRG